MLKNYPGDPVTVENSMQYLETLYSWLDTCCNSVSGCYAYNGRYLWVLSQPVDVCGCGFVDTSKSELSKDYVVPYKFSIPLNILSNRDEKADYFLPL